MDETALRTSNKPGLFWGGDIIMTKGSRTRQEQRLSKNYTKSLLATRCINLHHTRQGGCTMPLLAQTQVTQQLSGVSSRFPTTLVNISALTSGYHRCSLESGCIRPIPRLVIRSYVMYFISSISVCLRTNGIIFQDI